MGRRTRERQYRKKKGLDSVREWSGRDEGAKSFLHGKEAGDGELVDDGEEGGRVTVVVPEEEVSPSLDKFDFSKMASGVVFEKAFRTIAPLEPSWQGREEAGMGSA